MSLEEKIHIAPAFADARGEITNVLKLAGHEIEGLALIGTCRMIVHVAVITSKKGAVRAGHWHPEDVQAMLLVAGRYRSLARRHGTQDAPEEILAGPGDLIITPPGVDHAQHFLEDSVFLNLNSVDREPEDYGKHTIPLVDDEILIPSKDGYFVEPKPPLDADEAQCSLPPTRPQAMNPRHRGGHLIHAKFVLTEKRENAQYDGNSPTGFSAEAATETLVFNAAGGKANEAWSKPAWTTRGRLEIVITNPAALAQFELGKAYYLDFSPCPTASES